MSNWIKCSERMPDVGKVLVCFKKPFFGIPESTIECAYFDSPEHYADPSKAQGWLYWKDDRPVCYQVTHWMYLPDAPQDD